MSRYQALPGLDAASYERHLLHAENRLWVEKNCYVDIYIELLHALGLEPTAAMGFCASINFNRDNFTFFKPSPDEMRTLYGVEVQELNVWLPLIDHAVNHLSRGTFVSTEADSYYLPDTSGTDYRTNHVKTTIIIADIDSDHHRLGYFHNAGYFSLEGDDYEHLFRLAAQPNAAVLPMYAELIHIDRLVIRPPNELRSLARTLLAKHVEYAPAKNPVSEFGDSFNKDLEWIQSRGLNFFHAWAFATLRQLGAASELLSLHIRWLTDEEGDTVLLSAAQDFEELSADTRTLILKVARAVNSQKPFDAAASIDRMARCYEAGMSALCSRFAGR